MNIKTQRINKRHQIQETRPVWLEEEMAEQLKEGKGVRALAWVSLAFKLPSDFPAQPGLWEKLREFFQTAVVRHLQASLEFGLKSPTEGPHLFLN